MAEKRERGGEESEEGEGAEAAGEESKATGRRRLLGRVKGGQGR
jgi:hypothetical protein